MSEPFKAVEWMRKRRAELDREYEGLSLEERARRIEETLRGNPMWEHLKNRVVGPTTVASRSSADDAE